MKKHLLRNVAVACGVMLMANVALAGKADIEKKARNTIIDMVSFKNATIEMALATIADKAGILIKKVDIPKDTTVTLEAKYISALDALKIVTELANLTYTITDEGVEVSGKKPGGSGKNDDAGKDQTGPAPMTVLPSK